METSLREKLRSVLGDAPVSSITPTCALDSGAAMSFTAFPTARASLTPPLSHESLLAPPAPAPTAPVEPTPTSVEPKQTTNLLDFKFLALVAIAVVCITIVLCLMIPRKEERDLTMNVQSEDDGYIESPRQQRTRKRPVLTDDDDDAELEQVPGTNHNRRAPQNHDDIHAPPETLQRTRPTVAPRAVATRSPPEQSTQNTRSRPAPQNADPMFQPLRK